MKKCEIALKSSKPRAKIIYSSAANIITRAVKTTFLKGLCQLESMRSEVMQITFNCQNSIVFNA